MSKRTQDQPASSQRPEFFRLPSKGQDPFFGLTRPWYYAAEQRGDIKLVRIKAGGKARGVTLVPYEAVAAFIHMSAGRKS